VQQGAKSHTQRQFKQPELFTSVMRWDLKAVQDLWHSGVNLNSEDEHGRTSLDVILAEFKMPVEESADDPLHERSNYRVGNTIMAFRKGSKILEAAIVLGVAKIPPGTCIKLEVRFNFDHEVQSIDLSQVPDRKEEVELLRWMTSHGAVANYRTVHEEALKGDVAQLRFFTSLGFDPNARDEYERTPLKIAAKYGHLEMCQHLLSVRAEVGSRDKLGSTALHLARMPEVAALLIENQADPNACDESGNSALHTVADPDVCRTLIMSGSLLSLCNSFGQTPMHTAVHGGRLHCVYELVKANASIEARDSSGKTPFHIVQDAACAKLLHEAGARLTVEEMSEVQKRSLVRSEDPQVPATLRQEAAQLHSWLLQLASPGSEAAAGSINAPVNKAAQLAKYKEASSKRYDPRWRNFQVSERADEALQEIEKNMVWMPPELGARLDMTEGSKSRAKTPQNPRRAMTHR